MRRSLTLLVLVLGLVAAACAGSSSDGDTGGNVADDGATTSVTVRPGGTIDGPVAPDFTLALGADGSESFTLSDGAMPVYMVFWAEW